MSKKRRLAHAAAKRQTSTPRNAPPPRHNIQSTAPRNGQPKKSIVPKNTKSSSSSSSSSTTKESPTIPFRPDDDAILLVGEGDLSFAASLVDHHHCPRVTATVLEDSPAALAQKYPQAAAHAARIEAAGGRVLYGVDAASMGPWTVTRRTRTVSGSGGGNKDRVGAMDRILFNFPHVGGKSTDVNRQVRHNQELLVAFFRRALRSLAPGGAIVVTLFEGEPYTLWNIRDLARHAGLQVERSFRFQFSAYPGYHHARTLGVVRTRREGGTEDGQRQVGGDDGVSTSAWRGEDRPARSYIFVRKDDVALSQPVSQPKKKRKRPGDSSDDDDDDDDDRN